MESEEGDERVKFILKNENVSIPWIALAELFYVTTREKGEETAELRYAMLKRSGAQILWGSDEGVLLSAGRLKAAHRISFADSLIAAYALRNEAVLVHKDPEYEQLKDRLQMEALPYK
ncbi:type II toxin-antitoxin system VapC family toxin [Chloroflexi bacterium CFX6]|nr:type II toxin-antitoxin system VapC family toxin [Chloroflexi bacterium CFX6]